MTKKIKLKENDLKNIPGVGKNMEQHFFDIGIFTIDDLIGQNPEELFLKDCLVKDCRSIGVTVCFSFIRILRK